jgi:hypothetical protein
MLNLSARDFVTATVYHDRRFYDGAVRQRFRTAQRRREMAGDATRSAEDRQGRFGQRQLYDGSNVSFRFRIENAYMARFKSSGCGTELTFSENIQYIARSYRIQSVMRESAPVNGFAVYQ